jgi:uncharacterized protein (DUF2267 family)
MAFNFEKYAQDGNLFIKNLAQELGHPDELGRTGILLRAVLHTLRDRITISQSLHVLSQLPMFMKAIYVDNWKYQEKPEKYTSLEDFISAVEAYQKKYGEQEFSWNKSTEALVKIVFKEMGSFISHGEFKNVVAQMPKELEQLFTESIHAG